MATDRKTDLKPTEIYFNNPGEKKVLDTVATLSASSGSTH